jgi:hypothetical protein
MSSSSAVAEANILLKKLRRRSLVSPPRWSELEEGGVA